MGKNGRYLKKKEKKPLGWKKIVLIVLAVIVGLIAAVVIGGVLYYNHLLNMITRPDDVTQDTAATIAEVETDNSELLYSEETEETATETTSPEDTWPVVVSDENITNIMLVGQAAREGEEALIADSMILVSINRENKTLTLTSFMRDLRLVWPSFVDANGKSHKGHNRINMAYNMGYRWAGNVQGGMDLLASIVEYNFGVHVDHTIEVDFEIFMKVVDLLDGVTVEFNDDELNYMMNNYGSYEPNASLVAGYNRLDGYQALCYARMRKVGGDQERTARQREVITNLFNKLKNMNILEVHKLFTEVLPLITTDMTNQEITNYALEFIPMLKNLTIQSQRIPFEDTWWSDPQEIDGVTDYQISCNTTKNGELLRASIGMTEESE